MQHPAKTAGLSAWKWVLGPWMAIVTGLAYFWAQPLENGFQEPEAARIIFWHVPMAMLGLAWFWAGAVYALKLLFGKRRDDPKLDAKVRYTSEIGLLCTILATITGSVFARVQWGMFWNWDPKQVSIVVLILVYLAYFALRLSVEDPQKRARLSAVYAILGAVATPFLMYVIPQLPQIKVLHPDTVIVGGLDAKWRTIYWMSTLGFVGTTMWLFQLRLRLQDLEEGLESMAARAGALAGPQIRVEAVRNPAREG